MDKGMRRFQMPRSQTGRLVSGAHLRDRYGGSSCAVTTGIPSKSAECDPPPPPLYAAMQSLMNNSVQIAEVKAWDLKLVKLPIMVHSNITAFLQYNTKSGKLRVALLYDSEQISNPAAAGKRLMDLIQNENFYLTLATALQKLGATAALAKLNTAADKLTATRKELSTAQTNLDSIVKTMLN